MIKNVEGLPINELARRALSKKTIKLPKAIHDALQNIFTKNRKNENQDKVKFRKHIIKRSSPDSSGKHEVIKGKENSIYNALCLLYLLGTRETKTIFQHYYSTQQTPEKRDFSVLKKQSKKQYLEFFCLGVARENIDKIEEHLLSNDFNLFTDKLPSPFSNNTENKYDLTPMLRLHQQDIPWEEYMLSYQKADTYFTEKKFSAAKDVLCELETKALIRLPIVEYLTVKIRAEEKENKDAWEYMQKILN